MSLSPAPYAQVHHAQQAGAAAAIVYDHVDERLIIMSKLPSQTDPAIPSVFLTHSSGTQRTPGTPPSSSPAPPPGSHLPPCSPPPAPQVS